MPGDGTARPGGEHVYDALRAGGIDLLVGLPGTQTLPLDRVVAAREPDEKTDPARPEGVVDVFAPGAGRSVSWHVRRVPQAGANRFWSGDRGTDVSYISK
jgi:hypothetical protein